MGKPTEVQLGPYGCNHSGKGLALSTMYGGNGGCTADDDANCNFHHSAAERSMSVHATEIEKEITHATRTGLTASQVISLVVLRRVLVHTPTQLAMQALFIFSIPLLSVVGNIYKSPVMKIAMMPTFFFVGICNAQTAGMGITRTYKSLTRLKAPWTSPYSTDC